MRVCGNTSESLRNMAQIVETSVAAVKMSGSFATHEFSSSDEEGEEVTQSLRRPRSNAVLEPDSMTGSPLQATETHPDSPRTREMLSSCDVNRSPSTSNGRYATPSSSPVEVAATCSKIETGSHAQRDDTAVPNSMLTSATRVSDTASARINDLENTLTEKTDMDSEGTDEIILSSKNCHNGRSQMASPEILSSTSSPVMVNKSDTEANRRANSALSSASGASSGSSLREIYHQTRFNPFDNDIHLEEDHFSDNPDSNYFSGKNSSPRSAVSSQSSEQWNEGSLSVEDNNCVALAELGLSEDHFSHPEGHFGLSQTEELEIAIDNCKDLIRKAMSGTDRQNCLVRTLIHLRLKLQEMKDAPETKENNVVTVLGHRLQRKKSRSSKYYCEKCNSLIWGLVQEWRRCEDCGFKCHDKCATQITRNCAMVKVRENPTFIMEICPRNPRGLAAQDSRCAECKTIIPVADGVEPRLCQYNGRYYCEMCHWNDLMHTPAQILLNWDFEKRKVCRASKQFLKLMMTKAVINVQEINPMLFSYVEQLNDVKMLREEVLMMKTYILACPTAMQAKLLLQLSSRPHFVECSDRYSLQDLLDSDDSLIPDLVQVHSTWAQHIKTDCQLCQARGFVCELCANKEVLFAFDNIAVVCTSCSAVMHRICFAQKVMCPKCERRRKRQQEDS